jgi:hypothetical protein
MKTLLKKFFGESAKARTVKIEDVPVQIFTAGDYSQQGKGVWTEEDLDSIVKAFDSGNFGVIPKIKLDHANSPAINGQPGPFGRVAKLARDGKKLMATFTEVAERFKDWIQERPYIERSVELYPAATFGQPCLRNVAFVTDAPEAKGMDPLPGFDEENRPFVAVGHICGLEFEEFTLVKTWPVQGDGDADEDDDGHYHMSQLDEGGSGVTSGPITIDGCEETMDAADHTHKVKAFRVQPGGIEGHVHGLSFTTGTRRVDVIHTEPPVNNMNSIPAVAAMDDGNAVEQGPAAEMAESQPTQSIPAAVAVMTEARKMELQEQLDAVKQENDALKAQFAESERKQRAAEFKGFCESLVAAGAPPAMLNRPGLFEFAETLGGEAITFGEGEAKVAKAPRELFKEFLSGLKGIVPMKESGCPSASELEPDTENARLDREALAFQEKNPGVTYASALAAVSKQGK